MSIGTNSVEAVMLGSMIMSFGGPDRLRHLREYARLRDHYERNAEPISDVRYVEAAGLAKSYIQVRR